MTQIIHKKTLGQRDMVLFTVSAILLADTLAAAASVGASAISWWAILGIFFYIPFAAICAEMGCAYPEQGGIYAWIRDSFGPKWAARASWCYWVNTAVWIPAILILFAGVFKQLFFPEMTLAAQITMSIVLVWVAMYANIVALKVGKWVPNIGAMLKMGLFIIVIAGAWSYTQTNGMANEISFETLTPSWGESVQYLPAIIYGMLGFELVSASAEEMKNPARDVPKATFISGVIIIGLYALGTVAMLAAIPAKDIDLVEGLVDTFELFFAESIGMWFVILLGVAALHTFYSNAVTWAMGSNRAACEAAIAGELPSSLGVMDEARGTPKGAAIIMGVVASVLLILYGFMAESSEELFWTLFAFSAVIFLLPYLGMVLSFIYLRKTDGEQPRPFKIPFGMAGAYIAAFFTGAILFIAMILFMWAPEIGAQWEVIGGVVVTLVLGELAIWFAEHEMSSRSVIPRL